MFARGRLVGVLAGGMLVAAIGDGCSYTTRSSISAPAVQANASAANVSVSASGRWVVFDSAADNLVPGDSNGQRDVFRYDRQDKQMLIISVTDGETPATGGSSRNPSVDGSGRVAFESTATNLVSGDTNGVSDVFVRNPEATMGTNGTTTRMSVTSGGSPSQGNAGSFNPALSYDGTRVAFASDATNLFAADTNARRDVFVRTGASTTPISCAAYAAGACAAGGDGTSDEPAITTGGTVAFQSDATNFTGGTANGVTDVFVKLASAPTGLPEVRSGTVAAPANGASTSPDVTPSGSSLVYESTATNLVAGDANGDADVFLAAVAAEGASSRVSLTDAGAEIPEGGTAPAVSDDGRYVSFLSAGSTVVGGDTNGAADVFRRDRTAATTVRASVADDEAQADGASAEPAISGDGATLAFASGATNLVGGDTNAATDAFAREPGPATTEQVSKSTGGAAIGNLSSGDPSASADGRYVAFNTFAQNLVPLGPVTAPQVVVRDHQAGGTVALASRATDGTAANRSSLYPAISGDGRYVAFQSHAFNLVAGDTNGAEDVFVHDRQTGVTSRVSVGPGGAQATGPSSRPAISDDGRYVAFQSGAYDLVPNDTNNTPDIFVRDRQTGTTTRASVATDGAQASSYSDSAAISGDGSTVAFVTHAGNIAPGSVANRANVVVRAGGVTSLISQSSGGVTADADSGSPDVSGDGSRVAFDSKATNLVGGDTNAQDDVFLRDRTAGTTSRLSLTSGGVQGNHYSLDPSISADGTKVAFRSAAPNLAPEDGNALRVLMRDLSHDRTTLLSTTISGQPPNGSSDAPDISGDGRYVALATAARLDSLTTGIPDGVSNVYLKFTRRPLPASTGPSSGARGQTVNVSILGSGFEPGDQVGVTGDGVTVSNVTVAGDGLITATFQISPAATTGQRTIGVSRIGGGWNPSLASAGACVSCFTVTP